MAARERRRSSRWLVLLSVLALLLAACGDDGDDAQARGDDMPTLTVGYSSTPGIGDLGTFLLWDELRRDGIVDVETQFFSDTDVVIQSLDRGDIDFATNTSPNAALAAADQGIDVRIFAGYIGPEFVLAGTRDIENPEDMEGTTTAVHSEGGTTGTYMTALLEKYELEDVEVLIIPNSGARAEALAGGQVDTAPVDLADSLILEEEYDDFHTILNFRDEFNIERTSIATTPFLEENDELVQTIVTTWVEVYRQMTEDPDWAASQAARFFGTLYEDNLGQLEDIVRTYAEEGLWDPDGGMSREGAENTVQFNIDYGDLDASAADRIDEFYDFSYIEGALEELGEFEG